jgi:predicted AAA+ superfamily ATPase
MACGIFKVYAAAMIHREMDEQRIRKALKRSRVVALIGPRQSGKTTLARQFAKQDSLNYFDLEDSRSLARLAEPDLALRPLKGLVVIDEVQRRPDLFPIVRVLADRKPLPARFLILGSASPDLLRQSTIGRPTAARNWTCCYSSKAAASASSANGATLPR